MTLNPTTDVVLQPVALTPREFDRVRRMIHTRAGIALADSKQSMVYSRLLKHLRARALGSFSAYLDLVERDPAGAANTEFINALTTNLTSFFREGYHFPVLAAHLQRLHRDVDRPLAIWCAAASTGEEPYSIAMTVVEALGEQDAADVQIIASDIDTSVLARAEAGVYPLERVATLGPQRLARFFQRGQGPQAGRVRVRPELRRLVTFARINLQDEHWPLPGPMDAIFCRNVLIYFERPTQVTIVRRMLTWMHPDALLFAGHSESFQHLGDVLTPKGHTVYSPVAHGPDAAGGGAPC